MHARGFVHRDIRPESLLVTIAEGKVWLTNFGFVSRVPRQRQPPTPPEVIAGALPYVSPEQTGRMNRSVDSRSDLYSLGVTLHEMATGALPFNAESPVEWLHCHIAREPAPAHTLPAPLRELIGVMQDMTDRRRGEEALGAVRSELARMTRVASLGALTASIAHEVNQPLSGILINATTGLRMLSAERPDVGAALETVRRTQRDAKRAGDVIARLRALFTKKEIATEPVDLNEATREVLALSLSEMQRNRTIVRSEFTDGLPRVMGDRIQLQQVILNLLLNASEAMSGIDNRPRQLLVRTQGDDTAGVCVTVKDVGVGLAPEELDNLFAAFHTTKKSGMGIGLSVSRSIIDSHGGRLWATPNSDGPGATFSFSIPVANAGA